MGSIRLTTSAVEAFCMAVMAEDSTLAIMAAIEAELLQAIHAVELL
jgi:hypothetical protein